MGHFNREEKGRSGGGRNFGGNRSFGAKRSFGGNRGGARPQMHDAVCDNCGQPCQLPFKPTGDKPVYCKDCFAKMGGGEKRFDRQVAPRPAFKKFDAPQQSGPSKADFDALNAKVDQILAILTDAITAGEEEFEEEEEVEELPEKKKRISKNSEVTE